MGKIGNHRAQDTFFQRRGDLEPQGRRQEASSLAGVGPFLQTLVWVQGTRPLLPAEEGPWIPEEMRQRPPACPSCSTSRLSAAGSAS